DAALQTALDAEETTRTQADAALQTALDAEETDRTQADAALQTALDAEETTRTQADAALQTALDAEETTRTQADAAVNAKIPAQASATTQLADKAFVNSSIQSNVANRVYSDDNKNSFATRAALLAATDFYNVNGELYTPTNNDYTLVISDEGAPDRFKNGQTRWRWTGSPLQLAFDYGVNERPFTAAQQAAIDSGVTETKVADILGKSEVAAGYTPEGALNIDGVTGETLMNDTEEIALYTHHLKIRVMNSTTFVIWFGLELFLNDATPFTAETFWQWLAAQGYTSEANSKPINGRYTTDGQSSLDAGAVWVNADVTQISVMTIASSGIGTQNITLSGKTTTVNDFVKTAPFNIAAHKHGFSIENMSGGFVGAPAPKVLQKI
ncbi:MAG: hypothetical protein LBH85_01245, partial [Treponema sp.]|nr:hypothetical protein [Treponema sp.]